MLFYHITQERGKHKLHVSAKLGENYMIIMILCQTSFNGHYKEN